MRTIIFTFVFNVLFGLLYLGPSVAFSAYAASTTIFLNVSYVFPVVALLVRGRGVLRQYQVEGVYFALGRSGWALNIVAAVFVIVTSVVRPCSGYSCLIVKFGREEEREDIRDIRENADVVAT